MRQFAWAQMVPDAVDTRLELHRIQLRGNDNTSWVTQHAIHVNIWNQWRVCVKDSPAVEYVEALSYPSDKYIRWYRGITRVYIGNPANRDTRVHGYQPVGVDRRMMEVNDMASVAIREPPSSSSQIAAVMKKVQTIIWRCMVSIEGTLGCTPSQHDTQATFPVQPSRRRPREHVPDRGARGVKRGARRHLGQGAGAGYPPVPPAPQRQEYADPGPAVVERDEESGGDPQSLPSGSGTSQMPPAPSSGFTAFQSPHPTGLGGLGHHLLRAQPVHQRHISLYRRHLRLMKRRGRMLSAAGIVLGRKPSDSRHPTGLSCIDIIFYFS
ncbi:hypothetical protein M9H77_11662 [Catharanthus roseus]|uniref:Uncharacterized protein n=1 Tax=Catharanthus roseus TaxID=4058 RepID=A0ACC0BFA4_CATRO|nr:hypothetical protein M9H77_11662 [Catharanthus roseus]